MRDLGTSGVDLPPSGTVRPKTSDAALPQTSAADRLKTYSAVVHLLIQGTAPCVAAVQAWAFEAAQQKIVAHRPAFVDLQLLAFVAAAQRLKTFEIVQQLMTLVDQQTTVEAAAAAAVPMRALAVGIRMRTPAIDLKALVGQRCSVLGVVQPWASGVVQLPTEVAAATDDLMAPERLGPSGVHQLRKVVAASVVQQVEELVLDQRVVVVAHLQRPVFVVQNLVFAAEPTLQMSAAVPLQACLAQDRQTAVQQQRTPARQQVVHWTKTPTVGWGPTLGVVQGRTWVQPQTLGVAVQVRTRGAVGRTWVVGLEWTLVAAVQ